ncbi:hypothetical protein SNEBB_000205 [Seison nebaliae]|nr:hypothetical protein SNEBB_000205 [Seison nebaliae]
MKNIAITSNFGYELTQMLIKKWKDILTDDGSLTEEVVAESLVENFPRKTKRQIQDKMKNLKSEYKKEVRKETNSGEISSAWPYYSGMAEIMELLNVRRNSKRNRSLRVVEETQSQLDEREPHLIQSQIEEIDQSNIGENDFRREILKEMKRGNDLMEEYLNHLKRNS